MKNTVKSSRKWKVEDVELRTGTTCASARRHYIKGISKVVFMFSGSMQQSNWTKENTLVAIIQLTKKYEIATYLSFTIEISAAVHS
jgi:hypothetical protein